MNGHSTLELVKHDETAKAPERDWDATAFELDAAALAPQVVVDTSLQVSYNDSPPEVHNIEESTKERAPSLHTPKRSFKRSLMITVLVVAVAVAIGVGVGTWRHRKNALHGSSTINSPPASRSTTPQNPIITSKPTTTDNTHYILNDTSLAALVYSGGDRQLFFQDNNGSIRYAIRTITENQWTIGPYLNLSSNPKNYTPLAATLYNDVEIWVDTNAGESFNTRSPMIGLQYVSESHVLISDHLKKGVWHRDSWFGNWSTAMDTRSLSFCSLPLTSGAENSTKLLINLALLIYESPTRQVSVLLQRGNTSSLTASSNEWVDITSQKSATLPDALHNRFDSDIAFSTTLYESDNKTRFSTPFACAANFSESEVGLLFYSPDPGRSTVVIRYEMDPAGLGVFYDLSNTTMIGSDDNNAIHRSDIAAFGTDYFIWINGTQPVAETNWNPQVPGTPKTSFPFARLASVTSPPTTYLYHQLNGTTFAEEQWDDQAGTWYTEYIVFSDS